ncbi:Rpn family recombination-promoting nuclease/putative transposase [Clostridium sp. C8]|uniref:Rpn family recombination-promoting nuclease/putative transposase n=1 Tax=Clostridium sp. C8 TaxID=1667357 RepID=UPI00069C2592|nr:Rpn family recombination-promoting nuclease/putative transposase [Clostridium sp. C8]
MLEEKKYKGDGILDIIDQAHDKLFKETFGNIEIAKDFMNEYLTTKLRGNQSRDIRTLKRFVYK